VRNWFRSFAFKWVNLHCYTAAPGGQSIYVNEDGPYFADESFAISHAGPGVLTMYNPGAPNCNGSQFMITLPAMMPEALDGTHVAFGQVVEGWDVIAALEQLGDARQEGDTFQRVTVESCGVVSYGAAAGAASASAVGGGVVGGAARSVVVGAAGAASGAGVVRKTAYHRGRGGGAGRGVGAKRGGLMQGLRGVAAARVAYAA
jgi:hypothetical protein